MGRFEDRVKETGATMSSGYAPTLKLSEKEGLTFEGVFVKTSTFKAQKAEDQDGLYGHFKVIETDAKAYKKGAEVDFEKGDEVALSLNKQLADFVATLAPGDGGLIRYNGKKLTKQGRKANNYDCARIPASEVVPF